MKKYRVVRDLQGGEFGMGRDYTAKEWLEQMVEWRDSDNSWGEWGDGEDEDTPESEIKYWTEQIKNGHEQELINYIAEIWGLEFEEVKE